MVQLVGVDDGPDRLHQAVGDVQYEYVDHAAFAVVGDPAGLAVDPGRLEVDAHLRGPAVQAEQEPDHLLGPGHRLGGRPGLAAAVADHDHVRREHRLERGEVALARRAQEAAGERVALDGVRVKARQVLLEAPARAAQSLAAGIG